MIAQELIQHLKTLPPNTKIVVRGYEDGYNDILQLKPPGAALAWAIANTAIMIYCN